MKKRERFETLFKNKAVTIKKIISPRLFTSKVFLQSCDEWVFIFKGNAKLDIDNENVSLLAGDSYFIPKNTKHRILKTSGKTETVWYAVYIK